MFRTYGHSLELARIQRGSASCTHSIVTQPYKWNVFSNEVIKERS